MSHIFLQAVYTLSVRVSLTLHRKLNSIWGASNQMKFKLKVTIKLSECRGYDHWGSPSLFPHLLLPALSTWVMWAWHLACKSCQMSHPTSDKMHSCNEVPDSGSTWVTRTSWRVERIERGTGLSPPDLRHCDLLPNPFSVIGCRRKQSHISLYASATAFAPLSEGFSIVQLLLLPTSRPQVVARVGIELSRLRVFGQLQ